MTGDVLTGVGALGGLSAVLAALLVAASRLLRVDEDPRIDRVEEMLPGANCGACGHPGCRAFAEALVAGAASPAGCTVGEPEAHARIAEWLGVAVGAATKRVARLACAGGSHVARMRAHYEGMQSCRAAALVAGGGKACFWGCLGLGDCEAACDFDAISMDRHGLPHVDEAKCTACGDCVEVCPKDLFSLHPADDRLFVACASHGAGDELLEDCQVACTACGRCALDGARWITMEGNLPVIASGARPTREPIERCPTGAIVWIDPEVGPQRGAAAPPIVRRSRLPDAPT